MESEVPGGAAQRNLELRGEIWAGDTTWAPPAQMWMGKKREWTGLTKEEWVMALEGFSAKQMQKKLSPRGSWMEIKESRVWQYRSSTDHRKPEGAHWIWLLVRNES